MLVTVQLDENIGSAYHNGVKYFSMAMLNPSTQIVLNQSAVVGLHPLRDRSFDGIYYIDTSSSKTRIKQCKKESEVPSGCFLYHNWLLNKRYK